MISDRYPAPGLNDLTDKNIIMWYMEGMAAEIVSIDTIYNKIANIREMKSINDVIATWTGGQLYGIHQAMEKARTYEPNTGWRIRMFPNIYKNSFQVPATITEWDDQRRFVEQQSAILGTFGIVTLDYVFVNLLNNAFDVNYPVYDGQPLCSLNHVLKNATGVLANRPAAGSAISQDTVSDGYTYFMSMKSDDGLLFSMRVAFLVVPPSQFGKAAQVLAQTLDPLANNNGTPALTASFSDYGVPKIIVSSKLTSPFAWFMLAGPATLSGNGHGLDLWFTPDGYPATKTIKKEDPDYTKHIGMFRVAPTITKVRGVWGNPGV